MTERARPPPHNATPSKSILRQTTSVLGRRKIDQIGNDGGDDSGEYGKSENPSKRRKVLFATEADSSTYDVEVRTQADIRMEVKKALDRHSRGDSEDYTTLKDYFVDDRKPYRPAGPGQEEEGLRPRELTGYVLALTSCAPLLKQKMFRDLVQATLKCTWVGRDERFVQTYIGYLGALVTVQGSYLSDVLEMIISKFGDTKRFTWTVPDFPEVPSRVMRARVHSALRRLLSIVPAAPRVLCDLLKSNFPYPEDPTSTHVAYVENVLRIRDYATEIGSDMLHLVVERLVRIDVDMQTDLDDLDDQLTSAVLRGLAQSQVAHATAEVDSEDSDTESVASIDSDDLELSRVNAVTGQVEKLDAIMNTLFEFHAPAFADPDSDLAMAHCDILLDEFKTTMLQTRRSRHTQFLLFHYVQRSEPLMRRFISTCEVIAFQSARHSVIRDFATSYLASFVARGAHLPAHLVRSVFGRILSAMERLRRNHEPTCRGPDVKRYYSYYSLCQAALYMFCFRWRDLVVSLPESVEHDDPLSFVGHDLNWGPETRTLLRNSMYSRLNPLKVCSGGIVEEFAKLAHKLNLMYLYPLLDANKRVRLSQFMSDSYSTGGALRDTSSGSIVDENLLQLDPYFPFDPYQLPRSKRWLDGDYIVWTPIRGLNADEDDDDDDSDSDEGEMDQDQDQLVDEDTATNTDGEDDD